ncbi:MAG: response regulator [Xanthobacteraceae bacterium]|jgi:DNA-binding NtrC family response regulator
MQPQARVSDDRTLEGLRLLVVEDDAILLMDLEQILQSAGAEIVLCRSVADALAALAENRIAAAVLDFRIGQETIVPVARQLSQRGTPFIFYTGQLPGDLSLAEWRRCAVVIKPAPARKIVAAVVEALNTKSAAAI